MTSIILDSKEASTNPKLERSLRNLMNIDSFKVESLGTGDILVGTYIIERKTPKDLLTRVEGRLHIFDQLDRLIERRNEGLIPILLVEGIISDAWEYRGIPKMKVIRAQIAELLNSIQLSKHIPIFKWDTHTQVISWIQNLAKTANDPNEVQLKTLKTHPRREMTMDEESLHKLQAFEGIGPKKSKRILEGFGSILNLIWRVRYSSELTVKQDAWVIFKKMVGKKTAIKFFDVLNHNYEGDKE